MEKKKPSKVLERVGIGAGITLAIFMVISMVEGMKITVPGTAGIIADVYRATMDLAHQELVDRGHPDHEALAQAVGAEGTSGMTWGSSVYDAFTAIPAVLVGNSTSNVMSLSCSTGTQGTSRLISPGETHILGVEEDFASCTIRFPRAK